MNKRNSSSFNPQSVNILAKLEKKRVRMPFFKK